MRRACRVVGVLCVAVSLIVWLALGANRGWTKTTRTRMEKDPLADGMEYPVVEKHLSPGVELPGVGLLVALALAGISFAFKPKLKH